MNVRVVAAVTLMCAVAAGCAKLIDKNTDTPTTKDAQVPYVNTPAAEMAPADKTTGLKSTTYCAPDAGGKYPYDTKRTGGETADDANGHYFFGEGGGCINRPIREAWATSMNQELMIWTENGNSGHFSTPAPPAGVARFFDVEYTHVEKGMGIKVKWNMTWYHTVLAGTPQAPERILINFRRYMGTKFIKYWEGSIILTKLADDVTGIWIRNQIRASRVTEVNARGGATDIITKIRTGAPDLGFLP